VLGAHDDGYRFSLALDENGCTTSRHQQLSKVNPRLGG
jgi:hypothetical protein